VAVLRGVSVKKNIMRSVTAEEVEQKEKERRRHPNLKNEWPARFSWLLQRPLYLKMIKN
jgi:hypothetical protein